MAKFVPMLGDITGKLGNVVFTRNRYGPMIRTRAVPVQARTPRRATARARLSAASALYRSTIAPLGYGPQWIAFAANFPYRGSIGSPSALYLTGQSFETGINTIRYLLGQPAVLQPPDDWGSYWPDPLQSVNSLESICVPGVSLIVRMNPTPFDITDCGVIIRATPPLPAGYSKPRLDSWRTLSTLQPIGYTRTGITVTGNPTRISINTSTNKIFVCSPGSDLVSIIDGATRAVTTQATGDNPVACAINETSNYLFTANYNDASCSVVPFGGGAPHSCVVGTKPNAVCSLGPVGTGAAVVNHDTNNISLVPTAGAAVNVNVGLGPTDIAYNSVTNLLYVVCPGDSSLHEVSVGLHTDTAIPLGVACSAVAVNTVTNKIYCVGVAKAKLYVIDGITHAVTSVAVAAGPTALAVNSATNKIYVASPGANAITSITAPALTTTTIVAGTTPCAVAINSVTNRIYVTNSGSNDVTIINGATDVPLQSLVGIGPTAVACNPLTNLTYVSDTGETLVTEIDGAVYNTYFPNSLDLTTEYKALFGAIPSAGQLFWVEAQIVRLRTSAGAETAYVMQPIESKAETFSVLSSPITVGTSPDTIAVNPATNKIYVANVASNDFTIIIGETNHTATYTAAAHPADVAVNPTGGKAYIACYNAGKVACFNPANGSVTLITAGTNPAAIAINSTTNKIYVANYGSNDVTEIDGITNATATISVGGTPTDIAVNPVTNKIYCVCNGASNVYEIDGATHATSHIALAADPLRVAVNSVTNRIYVVHNATSQVSDIDGATHAVTVIHVGLFPDDVAVNSVTNKIYTADYAAGTVSEIDGPTRAVTAIAVGAHPYLLALNTVTNKIYCSLLTPNKCAEIAGVGHAVTLHATGTAPHGVAVNTTTGSVYVANFADNTVTVI